MRTTKILIGVCLTVIMAAGSTVSALAQVNVPNATGPGATRPSAKGPSAKRPSGVRPPVAKRPNVALPLTVNECWGLGGDVLTAANCGGSSQACKTTTVKDGVQTTHYQCITKVQ